MKIPTKLKILLYPVYAKFGRQLLYYIECVKQAPDLAKAINRPVGWTRRHLFMDNLKYGAVAEDYLAFEFHRKSASEKATFLTTGKNWYYFTPKMVSREAMAIFNNKGEFGKHFSHLMKRDWIIAGSMNIDDWKNFIHNHHKVIAKPSDGSEGVGIFMVSEDNPLTVSKLEKLTEGGAQFVLEQLIVQHPDMVRLNPASVNTVRVETTIDASGKTHITNTICIIGTGGDVINNAHNGGVMCHVDPLTGVLSSWARNPKGKNLFRHPDTGLVFPGYQIPMWQEVLNFAEELAKVVPQARYIGWDIAITEKGPVVIEGNTYPGHCTQACDMTGRWPMLKSLM